MLSIVACKIKSHYVDLQHRSTSNNRELKDYVSCIISFKKIIKQKKRMKRHIMQCPPKQELAVTS